MADETTRTIVYRPDMTVDEAIEIVADAIDKYGRPYWLGYIPSRIRKLIPPQTLANLMEGGKRGDIKRVDKYQSIIDWTQEHLFEQVTPQVIMEIGEISYPTALKFIGERPDIFRKVKRGLYELRDPVADRNAQK